MSLNRKEEEIHFMTQLSGYQSRFGLSWKNIKGQAAEITIYAKYI